MTLILGQLLALAVLVLLSQQVFLTPQQLEDWGCIPFVIGAACALVGLYLRRGIEETAAWRSEPRRPPPGRGSLRALLAHPREVAIVIGLTMGGTLAFYTYTTYMQKFLVNTVGWAGTPPP